MPGDNKKRKNSSMLFKKARSQKQAHHGSSSFSDVTSNPANSSRGNDVTSNYVVGIGGNDVDSFKEDGVDDVMLFPSVTPWIVAVVTFVIRVYYVTNPTNWWVLHPDEVFQSMDVAHSEAYGYGFRPFEFISPARGNNLSHYQAREAMLGMNALRSPIYPQLLALVASLAFRLGLDVHPFLLWRITHVFITSGLPLAASFFIKASGQSSDVASLASVLIGASAHLNVFGTHTIINSFISPFIFLSLSRLVSLLFAAQRDNKNANSNSTFSREAAKAMNQRSLSSATTHCEEPYDSKDRNSLCDLHDDKSNSQIRETTITRLSHAKTHAPHRKMPLDRPTSRDVVFEDSCDRPSSMPLSNRIVETRNSLSSDSGFDNWSNISSSSSADNSFNDDCHSDDKGINNKSGNNNVTFSDSKLESQQAEPYYQNYTKGFLSTGCGDSPGSSLIPKISRTIVDLGAGLFLGICTYVRPDSCIFVAAIILANADPISFIRSVIKFKSLRTFIVGALVGVLTGVGDDFYFYQEMLVSPWQWFNFNVLSNLASHLYGSSGVNFYATSIFFGNIGIASTSFIFGIAIVHFLINILNLSKSEGRIEKSWKKSCKPNSTRGMLWRFLFEKSQNFKNISMFWSINSGYICSIAILVLVYSSFGHKEERFMHNVLTLYFIIVADFVMHGVHRIISLVLTKRLILFILTLSFSFSQWQAMPRNNGSELNQCLYFVSKQHDVRGLFLESQFPFTFSYSILHRRIPLLTILQKEFIEFDYGSLVSTNRSCFVKGDGCKAGYVSLNSVTNVIHISNSHGVIKHLLERSHKYNYAIISSSKEFFRPAFTPLYKTDRFTVWRFSDRIEDGHHLKRISSELEPDISQQARQEYEAEVLKQLGNYWVALNRFRNAMKHARDRTKLLASIVFCLQRLGLRHEARRAFKECLKESDRKECSKGDEARVPKLGSGSLT